jgi:hypothetical protein
MLETTLNQFPPGTPDFVTHDVLKDYIQDTAMKTGVHNITQYDTEVRSLSKSGSKWDIETVTLSIGGDGAMSKNSSSSVRINLLCGVHQLTLQ